MMDSYRLLFWSDWDRSNPKIERSNTDGSNRMEFVTTSLKLPNSLTIDYDRDEICWADAGVFKIGIYCHFSRYSLNLIIFYWYFFHFFFQQNVSTWMEIIAASFVQM